VTFSSFFLNYYYCYICTEEKIRTQKQLKKVQDTNTEKTKKRKATETVKSYKFRRIELNGHINLIVSDVFEYLFFPQKISTFRSGIVEENEQVSGCENCPRR